MEPAEPRETRRADTPRAQFERGWQPRLWVTLGLLILIAGYLLAFVSGNDEEASVDFVVAEARTSLIWVILLSLLAGLVGGVLLSQLHLRRQERRSSASTETPSSISDGDA
jgi:uncharacterized integral membrane protein